MLCPSISLLSIHHGKPHQSSSHSTVAAPGTIVAVYLASLVLQSLNFRFVPGEKLFVRPGTDRRRRKIKNYILSLHKEATCITTAWWIIRSTSKKYQLPRTTGNLNVTVLCWQIPINFHRFRRRRSDGVRPFGRRRRWRGQLLRQHLLPIRRGNSRSVWRNGGESENKC